MSVHVDEVTTRVVPAPTGGGEVENASVPRLGAAEAAWATYRRLARRESCRTGARGFDD